MSLFGRQAKFADRQSLQLMCDFQKKNTGVYVNCIFYLFLLMFFLQNLTAKHLEAETSVASLREDVRKLAAQGLVTFFSSYMYFHHTVWCNEYHDILDIVLYMCII